jgi:uncharacterized protein YacL (UPF0231 family)
MDSLLEFEHKIYQEASLSACTATFFVHKIEVPQNYLISV